MAWKKGKTPGPMAGRHHTKETRIKMSKSHKGVKHTPEHTLHIIEACKNSPIRQEFYRRLREQSKSKKSKK